MMRPRNLDTDLLRTFVAIANHGGFARAGASIHLSQPTVSLQMKRLEQRTGTKLFRRNGRALDLTEDGYRLLHYARRILALNDEAWATLAATEIAGAVRFGMIQDLTEAVLAHIVGTFSRANPKVRFEVLVGSSTELASALAKGTLDVALLAGRPGDATPLFRREKLTSPSIGGLKAAIRAGLGVTLRGTSFLDGDLVDLGHRAKLPPASPFEIVCATGRESSPAALELADFIRSMAPAAAIPAGPRRRR